MKFWPILMTFQSEQYVRKGGGTWEWHVCALSETPPPPLSDEIFSDAHFDDIPQKSSMHCTGGWHVCQWNLSCDLFWWHFPPYHQVSSLACHALLSWLCVAARMALHCTSCPISLTFHCVAGCWLTAGSKDHQPCLCFTLTMATTTELNLSWVFFGRSHCPAEKYVSVWLCQKRQAGEQRLTKCRWEMQLSGRVFNQNLSHSPFVWQPDQTMETKSVKKWPSVSIWKPLPVIAGVKQ